MTAKLVAQFRKNTLQGILTCKSYIDKAKSSLGESATENDILQEAMRLFNESVGGNIKKRAARDASEGVIICESMQGYAFILEVNCETDFVSRNEVFKDFVSNLAKLIAEKQPKNLEELLVLEISGVAVSSACEKLIIKIGENIKIGKFFTLQTESQLVAYNHGGRLAVLVEYSGLESVGKDIALHIAASAPAAIDESGVCAKILASEQELYESQAKETGKPAEVQAKMVQGKMAKFLSENTLFGQKFVKDEDVTVKQFLANNSTNVLSYKRVVLGEVEEV